MIPKVMLRKLYKNGSLKQDADEIIFQLQNNIYPATIIGLDPIKIDEQDFDVDKIKVV
ncbi:MAG: hydroxymethylglutaryl-CoA reductase, partial [Candidatus Heimdallarchaeota archaeon]